MPGLKRLSGRFWRLMEKRRASEVLAPARAPEGRFHHSAQRALYLSETAEGTRVAMAYYARPGDPEQVAIALELTNANVVDLQDPLHCERIGIDPAHAQTRWQKERANGKRASTWNISDKARELGADGMLYPSSSSKGITHLVLFRWNMSGAPDIRIASMA